MIECVIFDCDGTLVDSESLSSFLLVEMINDTGVSLDLARFEQQFKGWKLESILQRLSREYGIKYSNNFIAQFRKKEADLFLKHLKPIDGVFNMLSQIDFPVCIASNAPKSKLDISLKTTGLTDFFGDNIFSAHDIKRWKPLPDLFIHSANSMGVSADKCAVVEDSEAGISAGLIAGMATFYYNPSNIKIEHDKVVSFTNMKDLLPLLRSYPLFN